MLSVRAILARLPKRHKRKVVSGSRVTLNENFACKRGLSCNPRARVALTVGLPLPSCKQGLIHGQYKTCSADCGLQTGYKTRTKHYGLDIKRGLRYKMWTAD